MPIKKKCPLKGKVAQGKDLVIDLENFVNDVEPL